MPRARAAWWVPAIAASVLGYLALITYADVFGPGAAGVGLRFRDGTALVIEVVEGYPAAKAGLAPGDRILSADGARVPTLFDWWLAAANFEVARPLPIEFERGGQRRGATLSFDQHWRRFGAGTWFALGVRVTAQLVTLGLAVLIALRRPRDMVALVAAAWLAAVSVTDLAPLAGADPHTPAAPNGSLAIWRALPWWVTPPLWLGFTAFAFGPILAMVFYALFPRPMFSSRRAWILWALTWTPPAVVGVPRLLTILARGLYEPGHGVGKLAPWTTSFIGLAVAASLVVTVSLLVLRYRRFADLAERRRLRVVLVGTIVGLTVPATLAMSGFAELPAGVQGVLRSPLTRVLASILYLLLPVSLAYGILRHRLLDVGTILRQGLQYALARRVALSIAPACAVLLGIDLVVHGDQPLLAVLQARGWAYMAVAAAAALLYARRQKWLEALDRRFFRERYDAQRLLSEVVEEIRRAANLESVAPRVVLRVESALHPEYVTLLSRDPRDAAYRFVASAPTLPPNFALRADSKIAGLVRLLGRPVDTSAGDSGWLNEQLPHEETTFLRDSRIGLIVPVALGRDGGPESLLVLGIKRSEEPYSREDQDLLQAVAGSLELLADRPATSRSSGFAPAPADAEPTLLAEGFAECVRCGACQGRRATVCEFDGGELEVVRLPRELAGRYRLIRRLGRGGMGSVYEAADLSLERRVALKVIREDLVGSAEAAERFRREARASASVAHPNVITVYDFGIAAGRRAFLVMELLRGGTLRDLLRQRRRLEPATALSLLRPICDAVDAAHRQQLVHRDLKPENVFLVEDGKAGAVPRGMQGGEGKAGALPYSFRGGEDVTVKVLDFGIARFLSADQSQTTTVVTDRPIGTLHYMGPEQLRGGPPDRSWDIWALGVMAYEMLAGVLPFPSATVVDYQVAVLAARPLPITLKLGAAAGLDPFFARVLSANPAERPSSPLSLADALADALAHAVHDAR